MCACGAPVAQRRLGRPRVRCESCARDKAALGRSWRAEHPADVAAYNLARRNAYVKNKELRNDPTVRT
jgi:hypothetical protein